jgi:hypothetical protein
MAEWQPVQIISPEMKLHIPVINLEDQPHRDREAIARQLLSEEAARPFDLSEGPLLRVLLARLAEEDHMALLTMHHIISDGWSMGVLIRELSTLYEAFDKEQPSPLPDLPVQYADYAIWQREWLTGEVLEEHISYWKRRLSNLPVLQLPMMSKRPCVQTFRGASKNLSLPGGLAERLKSLCNREGVTLFMLLLSAFKTLLHRYSGQEDIVIATGIANRNRTETEGLIGFFVNMLVLRSDLSGNPTFQELLHRVRDVTLGAYTYQELPFDKLVEVLRPQRELASNPLFQAVFVFQDAPMSTARLADLTFSPIDIETKTSHFDLTLEVIDTRQRLMGAVHYNTDLFDEATVAQMLDNYSALLQTVADNPGLRLLDVPLAVSGAADRSGSGSNQPQDFENEQFMFGMN